MNTSDLSKPKYRVISDYPLSTFEIGDIIIDPSDDYFYEGFPRNKTWLLSDMPHIFKKLEWWEGIDTSEIKYFRLRIDIPYYKLIKDTVIPRGVYPLIRWDSLLPATKEEYENPKL